MKNKFRLIGKHAVAFDIVRRGGEVKKVFVSRESLPKLMEHNVSWYMSHDERGGGKFNIIGRVDGKQITLPVFLMGKQEGKVIEHIDGDSFNNRLSNLRFIDKSELAYKRKSNLITKSGVPGVSYHKSSGMWRARLKHKGRVVFERYYRIESLHIAKEELMEERKKLDGSSY